MRLLISLIVLLSFQDALLSQQNELFFATHPTLSPDGRTVIFCLDGDLWKVPAAGGTATRLTAMQGDELYPRVSPDGRWIAFTGAQYGSQDVYVMPLDGGEIRQLTFHEGFDHVDSWSWDSRAVYFTSNRYNRQSGYRVSLDGGTPQRLFGNYFNTVHSVVEHPKSGELFFNETWESKSAANRKRYQGAYNPDIQSYNPKTGEFKVYTSWKGKDLWYSIDRNGRLYYASDEANGEYNLYELRRGKAHGLTRFSTSIKNPQVSANGEKIVFEKDYQLWIYDVATQKIKKVPVQYFDNETLERAQDFEAKGNITAFDVSPDGKKIAFVSRGCLFACDIKGTFVRQMSTPPRGRVMEVKWLADNKTLLYNRTNTNGYTNWFTIRADGSEGEIQRTNTDRNDRDLVLNPKRTQGVYLSGRDELRLLHLDSTFRTELLAQDEFWGFQNPEPGFSPDGAYVYYSVRRNFELDIMVLNLATKTVTNLTESGVTETAPFWSPDGKSMYFIADRLRPGYPYGLTDAKLYRMPLTKFDEPFKSTKYEELFAEADTSKSKKMKKDTVKIETPATIDAAAIRPLIEEIGPGFGTQSGVYVTQKGDKTTVMFSSNHGEGEFYWWKTVYEPFSKPKTEKIKDTKTGNMQIVETGDKMYVGFGGNLYTLNLDGNKLEKIEISHAFRKNLADEFNQMFYETWANLEENFYNEDFHQTDWQGMKAQYAAFLPHLRSRDQLRTLINDMLGELNSSHLGFRSFGAEEQVFYKTQTSETGIIFREDNPLEVDYIVKNSAADKTSVDVKPGDKLVAVNGQPVDPAENRFRYFTQPSLDEELTLRFRRDTTEQDVLVHPQRPSTLSSLLYDEWIENNQHIVDERSNKQIAYVYMRNMTRPELDKFLIDMNTEAYQRKGLILDLRYNTGGNVHDDVLRFLSQKPYLKWKYREGAFTVQSNFTPSAYPIVLLVNEQSLSDAEMTAAGFKELRLGKIIGTETYRWIIFTSGKGLVDGSFYRLPSWGCYTLDGKNLEKEGVKPDITVKTTFKDRLEGSDPQLERAIEEVKRGM
ncbi:MAG: peptidase S41 [Bacteroidetes bacterium]|nr:MAG: peptidase S41 [Bacteroidota bacterium]